MKLPSKYLWLAYEGAPRHLMKALELYGVEEIVGVKHNPIIMSWAREVGVVYKSDETPWCGLFMAVVMKRAERQVVEGPLSARNWATFGIPSLSPMLGDVLVFKRPNGGGHVGIYVGEDNKNFYVLGGNQGNKVSVVKIAKSRLLAARKPPYFNPPSNIRKIHLNIDSSTSENEA